MHPRHTLAETAVGQLTIIAEDDAVVGVYFPGHWYPPPATALGARVEPADDPLLAETVRQLGDYLAGRRTGFDLLVAAQGDAFSEQVWSMIDAIPYGETTTYGTMAAALGNPALAQRVGQAVGHNPVSIIIPCHRVVGADGSLTGYAGGLERKRRLLDLEESDAAKSARLF